MSKRKRKTKISFRKYILPVIILIVFALICVGAGVNNLNEAAEVISDTVSELGGSISDTWTGKEEEQDVMARVVNRKT